MSASTPEPGAADRDHIVETPFWNEVLHGVLGPRKGGAKILIDAEDSSLGVGKTSLAVALARLFARAFDYDLKREDFTLSDVEYIQRYREHPPDSPSVIVLDELVGAGGGDSRRSMSNRNVELARAWQVMRSRQVITLTTLPSWSDADKRLRKLADYRCRCLRRPIGAFIPYRLGTFDFENSSGIRFNRLGNRVYFPKMDDDPFYQHLSDRKDELQDTSDFDSEAIGEDDPDPEEARDEERREIAIRLMKDGMSQRDAGQAVGRSQSWASEVWREEKED